MKLPTFNSKPKTCFKDAICLFYGPPGVGKTTFVKNLSEKTLFISTDRGTKYLKTMRQECHDFETLKDIIESLKKYKKHYDFVCLDHVDDISTIIEDHVCESLEVESLSDAGWGKGWKLFKSIFYSMVQDLMSMGFGLVFIAHQQIKKVESRHTKIDHTMPQLSKTAWDAVIPLAALIGFITVRSLKLKGEKKRRNHRVLITQPSEELYAKDRTDRKKPKGEFEFLNPQAFLRTFENNENSK